ncbi:MAG: phosphoribosylformylglycinamidine synthase subunit PurL [Candidatus Aminicenantes bacterium]|nr:phosphoribosylformylglycinamidine synthase subunit PurL [Candidatus Aminicenantes bacterium]
MIDSQLLADHNLSREEYDRILSLLGREPNQTELGIFSVMWSEHCCYKSSKAHLGKLPVEGRRVIQGPGENAGVLDIGDGLAAVFKIESHNHPSFIEPFQGAATGVGGILRDIFTMGARPVALLDSLRFGPLQDSRNRAIMEGVVSGISAYGNSIGVPTVGGETRFHDNYALNPLVNVFCLGLVRKDKIFYARAGEPGNQVLYVGAKTGRDGIHGATMASAEFGDRTEHKRPNVQVGDPFREKLLLEACLEVMDRGLIVGIQDMGAAGLTCSTTEIPAKSGLGISLDLDLVPQREKGMTPYEIMLSESQERMLIVAEPGRVDDVREVFAKWDLDAAVIGEITAGGRLAATWKGETVVDIPVDAVINSCPVYDRPAAPPAAPPPVVDLEKLPEPADLKEVLLRLLASPDLADKEWIFGQYDHMVQTNTALLPGADAAVLRIKGSSRALAATLDGNASYAALDPRRGAKITLAEACRNLACVGASPIGVTNCQNFGNPEKPEIMEQFKETIEGLAEACRALGLPVTGGNVSFYNETEGTSIPPTPVIGVLGVIEDIALMTTPGFKAEGEVILLLGRNKPELGGSDYLKTIHRTEAGPCPEIDLDLERRVHEAVIEAGRRGLLRSAHDASSGGLAVCLAECAFLSADGIGCDLDLGEEMRTDALLFGETQSRIVVTVKPENLDRLLALARKKRAPFAILGETGGTEIVFRHRDEEALRVSVAEARAAWTNALPAVFRAKKAL